MEQKTSCLFGNRGNEKRAFIEITELCNMFCKHCMNDSGERKCEGLEKEKIKRLSENIGILCNGEVITCCCDFFGRNSLGNIKDYDYSIKKLLKNGKLEELENNLKKHIYKGACADCTDWIYHQEKSVEKYVTVYPVKKKEN